MNPAGSHEDCKKDRHGVVSMQKDRGNGVDSQLAWEKENSANCQYHPVQE